MHRFWKSLRFRLAAWNAFVVILTGLATLLGLREGVYWALMHEMDQILTEDIVEIQLTLQGDHPQWQGLTTELDRKAIGHQHHHWFVQFLDVQGRPVWSSIDAPPQSLVAPVSAPGTPYTLDNYRLVQRKLKRGRSEFSAIRVGAALTLLKQDMAQIDRLVLRATGLILLIAPLVGYWLAGRAARTMGQLITTASQMRPSRLEERLPIRGTGDELDQLARTVNHLLDRIADYLQEKRDFLANAAHELRTPLTAIRSSVEVALSSERSSEEYQNLLLDIIEQGTSLELIVNQVLLISETEAERLKMDFDPVMLDQIVRKSADMFAGVAEARNIELHVTTESDVLVRGSKHLLRQLINNLLDNAIKYTLSGGDVWIQLAMDPSQHVVTFSVRDTGIGISEEDLPKVFDRFFRADRSRTRMTKAAGTGLGLSICQAVAKAHHGSICCTSTLGDGTELTVTLPAMESTEAAATFATLPNSS